MESAHSVPEFVPHPLLRSGHLQTIAGRFFFGARPRLHATGHEVEIEDGDRLHVLESVPATWAPGDPAAVLVHGLAGCAQSPFVVRVAIRLVRMGVRVVRMNLRGAGSGFGAARGFYHAGGTEGPRAVVQWLAARAPESPIGLVGFSLGGNLVLKLAAEAADEPVAGLAGIVAANPPIDLDACCRHLQRAENALYNRNFVKLLRREVRRLHAAFPDLEPVDLSRVRTVFDFDECYTAPRNGFRGAADYYERNSAAPLLPRIELPGLVIHAEDDPFIPAEPFRAAQFPAPLALELLPSGGHLGFVSRTCWQGDRRWLDARIVAWLADHWNTLRAGRPFVGSQELTMAGSPHGGPNVDVSVHVPV